MKRAIAIVLVIMMVCMAGMSVADDAKRSDIAGTVKDFTYTILKSYVDIYDILPTMFEDDDYAVTMYLYYKAYMAATSWRATELRMNIKNLVESDKIIFDDTARQQEKGTLVIIDYTDALYEQWLNGEITTVEFCERIVPIIKTIFET